MAVSRVFNEICVSGSVCDLALCTDSNGDGFSVYWHVSAVVITTHSSSFSEMNFSLALDCTVDICRQVVGKNFTLRIYRLLIT